MKYLHRKVEYNERMALENWLYRRNKQNQLFKLGRNTSLN